MIYLIVVSIIWSLSFSLIKGTLTSLDPNFVAFFRLLISFIIFLPFFRIKKIISKISLHFILIGAIQYGLMYSAYIYSYQYLKAYEIAILTIFTPIFVVIIFDSWAKKFVILHWIKAVLAIIGAGIIVYSNSTGIGFWKGILLVQISNILFAFGQVYYKRVMETQNSVNQKSNYSMVFLGAILITGIISITTTNYGNLAISPKQWLVLLYLGIIASGVGFFLWNVGATKVEAGTLAVMNNLKIPLGVIFAMIILSEPVGITRLIVGLIILIIAFSINNNTILKKPNNKTI